MHSPDLWELSPRLRTLVEEELNQDERIRWLGQPIPRRYAMRSLAMVLFAIPWTAFALFWMAGAAGFKIPDFNAGEHWFSLFGVPFVLIGLAMLCSPFWMLYQARKTVYLLTTSRAVVFKGGFATTIRSFSPKRLGSLQRRQHADGSGDLIFDKSVSYDSDGDARTTEHGFLAIAEVREVEKRIRELIAEA